MVLSNRGPVILEVVSCRMIIGINGVHNLTSPNISFINITQLASQRVQIILHAGD